MKTKLVLGSILLVGLPSFLWLYALLYCSNVPYDNRLAVVILGGTVQMFLLVIAILVSMYAIYRVKDVTPVDKRVFNPRV